jgi:hypothetical protein
MSRRGSGKGGAKQEPTGRSRGRHPRPEPPDEPQIPERYEYTAYDPLHGKIVVKLKEVVNELYDQAMENPNSEANEMVRILLLNQMANMNPETYHHEPRLTYTEERHRGVEAKRQKDLDQQKAKQFDMAYTKHQAELRKLNAQIQNLETEARSKEIKLQQAQRVVDQALAQAEHGQEMDHMTIYNKIAEVIGLRPPAGQQQAVGSGQ